ncbi:hypothetical protein ANCDUO_16114, partial [Ancylostoma duodenale]
VHVSNVCYRININYYMPSLQPTELRLSDLYRNIFFGWAYTIVMYVVPFSLLIILNSLVLSAVRRSRRMHMVSQCGVENDEFSKKAERKERQTSIMLIAIVLLFISCNTLAFVCNIMENLDEKTYCEDAIVLDWLCPKPGFVLSYVPGGERGLRFMSTLCTGFLRKSPTTVLPI